MIKILSFGGFVCAAMAASFAFGAENASTAATYVISGLHCPPCSRVVESALSRTKGVKSAKVDWAAKAARVQFDEQVVSANELADVLARTPHMMGGGMSYAGSLALSVPELKDAQSAKSATQVVEKLPGVAKAQAFPQGHTVTVQFKPGAKLTSAQLIAALAEVGLKAKTY